MTLRTTIVPLALLLFAPPPAAHALQSARSAKITAHASSANAEQELTAIMLAMAQASIRGDVEFFRNVLASEFTAVTVNGEMKNRDQILQDYIAKDITFQSHVFDDIKVRSYGDTAVITNHARAVSTYQGKPRTTDSRNTRTFVWRNGRWQCVAFQSTRIAKP